MVDNIYEIRRNAITEIKKKVNKNPGYSHPCNKERLEDMKMLKFENGNGFTYWMQQNGILVNPTELDRGITKKTVENAGCKTRAEYLDRCARDKGFDGVNERVSKWRYESGKGLPEEFREDCPSWFGNFTENLMIHRYPGAIRMPRNNPGFDYLWNGIKIDNKSRCLDYIDECLYWTFPIRRNNIADKFTLSGWNSRESLNPMYSWEFDKNDMVRIGKGNNPPKIEFWRRDYFTVIYTSEGLKRFEEYQIDIDWLKKLCDKDK